MAGRKKYNICLVGAGRMGTRWAGIITANRNTRLVCIVDPDREAGKKLADRYGADYAASLTKHALNAHTIDAVFVVTPHAYLYPNVKRALTSGCHVFVEKPGSKTARALQSLSLLAKNKGRTFMVGFNYRYFDAISRAKKLVDKGRIGKVLSVSIRHGHAGREGYGKEWRMDKRIAGGGVLMDQGVHVLDLARWFLGSEIRRVSSVVSDLYWKAGVEDNAFVILQDAKGHTASIWVSITMWRPTFIMEIVGTKGHCIVNGVGRKYGGGETLTIGRIKKDGTVSEKTMVCDSDPDKCLHEELKQFVALLRNQGKSNADDAISVLKMVRAAYGH